MYFDLFLNKICKKIHPFQVIIVPIFRQDFATLIQNYNKKLEAEDEQEKEPTSDNASCSKLLQDIVRRRTQSLLSNDESRDENEDNQEKTHDEKKTYAENEKKKTKGRMIIFEGIKHVKRFNR